MSTTGGATNSSHVRISRPAVPPNVVRRRRIDAALARGTNVVLTIVCAGPGYGKTLAVADWATRTDEHVVWLAAGRGGDVPSFWSDVLSAFEVAGFAAQGSVLGEFAPGSDLGLTDIDRIADAIAATSTPIDLVIDELQQIADTTVLESLSYLLARCPDNLRVILISRTRPSLPLSRLRLDGEVTEIHAETLAFTRAETAELCENAGVQVADADLDVLMARTQGWPAGLRLALLGGAPERDATSVDAALGQFSGRNRLVAAYLLEEVLAGLAPHTRRFLLATSIVPEVTADLARTLTGVADSRRELEALVAANALTVRLADRPEWFRYHPLLRELLYDRLQTDAPDSIDDLNRLAATWYSGTGDHVAAIRHLIAAREPNAAARVLGAYAVPLMLTARAAELAAALEPAETELSAMPLASAHVIGAVLAYHRRDYLAMEQHAGLADRLLADQDVEPEPAIGIVVTLVHMVIARFRDIAELGTRAAAVSEAARSASLDELPSAPAYMVIGDNNLAIDHLLSGRLAEAEALLQDCRRLATSAGMDLVAVAADGYLSVLEVIEGRIDDAGRHSEALLEAAVRRGWSRQPQVIISQAVGLAVALHADRLDAAAARLNWIRAHHSGGASDLGALMIVEIYAIQIAVAAGDVAAAGIAAERLNVIRARAGHLPALLDRWMHVALIRMHLLFGDIEAAQAAVVGLPGEPGFAAALERVVCAEVTLATGHAADVPSILGAMTTYAEYPVVRCDALVLAAVAAGRLRRDAEAVDRLGEALHVADATGVVRPFVAWADDVRPVLARYRMLTTHQPTIVQRIVELSGGGAATIDPDTEPLATQPLTDRELTVLRYLPTMFKAAEIAADLFVSVNTVKTHQQSIYRKLGVTTRREAVDRAREHKLL
ncbi:LuxR C-terminal-related transcriptional regulator [Gordonia sp. DT30]|uniref:helix-turn-helix transcriptional regulator n=1 Tax=unclassified Gordonia (in: high G+C Gram-positive bacteria) TaxID=2657482 RepID=UPI003CEAD657